jgi:hypothetical protein
LERVRGFLDDAKRDGIPELSRRTIVADAPSGRIL